MSSMDSSSGESRECCTQMKLCTTSLSLSFSERKGKESAAMKADLLRARNMKRYINQLTVAKKQCEKRIRQLGGPNYENSEEGGAEESDDPQSQRVGLKNWNVMLYWLFTTLRNNGATQLLRRDSCQLWAALELLICAALTMWNGGMCILFSNIFLSSLHPDSPVWWHLE